MTSLLPIDATLRSIAPIIPNAEEYVRRVLSNMSRDFRVRVARDGNHKWPDYLVEMLFFDEETGEEIIGVQSLAVHNGRTHKGSLFDEANGVRPWSEGAMTFVEVQALIGDNRGYVRPKQTER